MTWVKLCGLRTHDDVAAAEAAGADAVGFVTAARSVRRVSVALAAELGEACSLERFLVTEDEGPDALVDAARRAGVTGVQPHGEHAFAAAEAALAVGLSVLFPVAVPVGAEVRLPEGAIPILDGDVPGSGSTFEWGAIGAPPDRYVVAGGLTPDNVDQVLEALTPYGVDVSSGIERAPGVKDHELMRRFLEATR